MGAKKRCKERRKSRETNSDNRNTASGGRRLSCIPGFRPAAGVFKTCGRRQDGTAWLCSSFGAIGAFLAGWSLKKFIKGEYIKYGEIPDDEEEEQTED